MKPAWFDYYAPRELSEALHILGDAGQDGRVLAGGQSLMPMLNLRILSPAVVVDINRIEPLNELHADKDYLTVGALVRHADLLRSADVREGLAIACGGDHAGRAHGDQKSRDCVRQCLS